MCSKCWNVAKRLRHWFLIPTFEGSNPSIPEYFLKLRKEIPYMCTESLYVVLRNITS